MWTRIGATPATLTMSQWTTPSVIPAATPASIALPPAARTRDAASDASGWPAATAQRVPITCGADVGVWLGAFCWELTLSRLMAAIILARTHPAKGARARLERHELCAHRRVDIDHRGGLSRARVRQHGLHPCDPAGGRRAGPAPPAARRRGAPRVPETPRRRPAHWRRRRVP